MVKIDRTVQKLHHFIRTQEGAAASHAVSEVDEPMVV
jgi:hypothetical protein